MADTNVLKSPGRVIAAFLAGSWRAAPSKTETSEHELRLIAPLLLRSGAGSLAWWRIRDTELSVSDVAPQLKDAYQLHSLQAAIHRTEIEEAVTMLNAAGFEPALVKGWAVARLYPEEGLRPYGDIDLCFDAGRFQEAKDALSTSELRRYSVDAHDGFAKLDRAHQHLILARTAAVRIGDARFRVLAAEDQLRILCTHLLKHSAWRPLWLCDIAAAVESRPANFDWDRCLGTDELQADWVRCALGLAGHLLGANVDDTPASERAKPLPGWLIRNVIKNWDHPFPELYPPLSYVMPIAAYLRTGAGLFAALGRRWPGPIEATIRLRGPFNEMPRLPFQIGNTVLRIARFVAHTPDEE